MSSLACFGLRETGSGQKEKSLSHSEPFVGGLASIWRAERSCASLRTRPTFSEKLSTLYSVPRLPGFVLWVMIKSTVAESNWKCGNAVTVFMSTPIGDPATHRCKWCSFPPWRRPEIRRVIEKHKRNYEKQSAGCAHRIQAEMFALIEPCSLSVVNFAGGKRQRRIRDSGDGRTAFGDGYISMRDQLCHPSNKQP